MSAILETTTTTRMSVGTVAGDQHGTTSAGDVSIAALSSGEMSDASWFFSS